MSSIKGLMSTTSLYRLAHLRDLHNNPYGIYTQGVIIDVAPRQVEFAFFARKLVSCSECSVCLFHILDSTDTACLQKLKKTDEGCYECNACHVTLPNPHRQGGEWVYSLQLDVNDDTGTLIRAELHSGAAHELLELPAADFMELRPHEQLSLLANKVAQEFIFSISAVCLDEVGGFECGGNFATFA